MIGSATPTGMWGAGTVGTRRARRGFSLIELVIVVVIIGIIAAIAVPRMSRGSQGAADSALRGNLTVLRNAIDLYQTEHQTYPGTGSFNTVADLERQLTKYTDGTGDSAAGGVKDSTHNFGPYLRKIPQLPVGENKKGLSSIKFATADNEAPGTGAEAWIYYPNTGEIKANLASGEKDTSGNAYSSY